MIRMMFLSAGLFAVFATVWAVHDPIESSFEVGQLGEPGADYASVESALLRRGRGSIWALRRGVQSPDPIKRLRCARLLALMGDEGYDETILKALRERRTEAEAVLAEMMMLTIWDRRHGPPADDALEALREPALENGSRKISWKRSRTQLDLLISQYPAWSSGYVARARLRLANREVRAAIEDAVTALYWEPKNFEAIQLLAQSYLMLDYPEQAQDLYEQALVINPGIMPLIREQYQQAREEAAAERERRLIERRKELPAI